MRPTAPHLQFIRDLSISDLISAPGPVDLVTFAVTEYDCWNIDHPSYILTCSGQNKRQALDDAMIKLACAGHRVRLRPSLPAATLPGSRKA